jgi:hypothetical protein
VIGMSTRVVLVFQGGGNHAAVSWGYWYFRVTR